MPAARLASWSSIVKSCTINNEHREALLAFQRLRRAGILPDYFAVAAAVKSAATLPLPDPRLGASLHAYAVRGRYLGDSDSIVKKALMDMYARSNRLSDTWRLFGETGRKDTVVWNLLLSAHARGELYCEVLRLLSSMHACGDDEVRPSGVTMAIVLPVCGKLRFADVTECIHGHAIRTGLMAETLVGNALVSTYAKCGGLFLNAAHKVFDLMYCKDVVSWNSMIAGYTENGIFEQTIDLFSKMHVTGICPNDSTLASIIPVCAFLERGWCWGKVIHGLVWRCGLATDVSICNALMAHYARAGDMVEAEILFQDMCTRDIVSWNTMIAGYTMNRLQQRALQLYQELLACSDLVPDYVTYVTILPTFALMGDVQAGRAIHDTARMDPALFQNTSIGNALVSLYGKCGYLADAVQTFSQIQKKDLVSWNAMLSAYVDNQRMEDVIGFVQNMIKEGMIPDSITLLAVLEACSAIGSRMVKEVHGYGIRSNLICITAFGNAILNAYAKYYSIESASAVFENLQNRNVMSNNSMILAFMNHGFHREAEAVFSTVQERDLTTWNTMIQACAQSNYFDEAIGLLMGLHLTGLSPDGTSLLNILPVCVALASVSLLKQCHGYAIRACLYDVHLHGALVNAYSKCGSINDAYSLFRKSLDRDIVTYTAILGGFARNGLAKEAIAIYDEMCEHGIKPDHVVLTVLLSACSHSGLIDEGWKLFRSMEKIHGIVPTMEHYSCVVDLLARRGHVKEAYHFVASMPCEPNASIWGTILGACKIHKETEIGRLVAEQLFHTEQENIGNYVVLSNIYAAEEKWDGVEEVRGLMRAIDLRKPAGCSWIEVKSVSHVFIAGDLSHSDRSRIYFLLRTLDKLIKDPRI